MTQNKIMKRLLVVLAFSAMTILFGGMKAQAATYKVVSGDTLYKLGILFSTSADNIAKQNGLSTSLIYPNQQLTVPADVYSVKNGDTLFLIAKKYGIDLNALQKANNQWNDMIYPNQKLNLPGIINGVLQSKTTSGGASSTIGVIPYSQSDVSLLARLIMSEAEGEPYLGKVAVGAVVVNRVQSGLFANNIKDVIYQRINGYYQFTPVMIGTIDKPATADCYKAAYEALGGADPTNGALFYFDNTATNPWLLAKPVSITIDNLIFSY